jgi:putative endonuclease
MSKLKYNKSTKYFTYILECSDGTFYIGIARDINQRIKQHNGEIKGGASYTSGRRPVQLKYREEYKSRGEATKRELELKKFSRKRKMLLFDRPSNNS